MHGHDANEMLVPFRDADGEGAIVFDPRRLPQPRPDAFDPAHWGAGARAVGGSGRGAAWFVDAPDGSMVLRHYLRGGQAARISRDQFLWHGPRRTRGLAEFRLLQALHARGLPVPAPIAAMYRRSGVAYRAAILLERIPGAQSLADLLAAGGDGPLPWQASGAMVARFHRAGVRHADLNAHNILFDDHGAPWLIDFDKGAMRRHSGAWQSASLDRLERSLRKLGDTLPATALDARIGWLRNAYATAITGGPA